MKAKDKATPLFNSFGDLLTKKIKKLRYSTHFLFVFSLARSAFRSHRSLYLLTLILGNITLPTVQGDRLRDLSQDILMFMGLVGLHVMVLREPCSVTVRLLCIIFSCQKLMAIGEHFL